MKTIFLMRHGETLFNVMDVNQGQCDSPLTENGINQALAAKEWFKNQKIHFDSVYSSTAERACDTAWLVSGMPYERKKGLKEIFLGTKEASPNSENPEYPYGDYSDCDAWNGNATFPQGSWLPAGRNRLYRKLWDCATPI